LTDEAGNVKVQVKYKDVEESFSGNLEEVWLSIRKFFLEFIPSFDIANRLTLKIDLQKLSKDCEGLIAFSQEGPAILVPRTRLTDSEYLSLRLLASYVGYQLGILKSDTVSREELQAKLGKDAKIASTRLGELIKNGTAARTLDEEYRLTAFGITQIQKETLPKIRTKMGTQGSPRFLQG
jgi:hypothetical protein